MSPTVAHFKDTYLPLTETFIYQYLTNHDRYDGILCALETSNIDKYPYQPRYVFLDLPRWSPRFWTYGVIAKLGIRELQDTFYGHVIRTQSPDILHAHFGPIGVHVMRHRTSERPLVTTFYGYDASKLVREDPTIVANYEQLFATGDLFLVEGPSMKEKIRNLGCPDEKLALQRIAIDVDSIEPRYPEPCSDLSVLMVGRFTEKKGFSDGIRAFALAFQDHPAAELRIVGDEVGEYPREDLERVAIECGVRNQVTFTGFLDYQKYLTEIRSCDVFFAPSKTARSGDSEGGAPTVLLEAQAMGKPIVSTRHADIPFVINENDSGFLATPGDVDELATVLSKFISNPGLLPEMGKSGREYVQQHHDIDELSRRLERLYDEVLDRDS